MKTDYEWQETLDGTVGGVQEREVIRAIQRDAWEAGCIAQKNSIAWRNPTISSAILDEPTPPYPEATP
jgi:hypothetical protein